MKLALFGAGTMGRGIAQVFAAKGHTVLLYASSPSSAQRHKDTLGKSLDKLVAREKMTVEAKEALLANIQIPFNTMSGEETTKVFNDTYYADYKALWATDPWA